MTSKYIPLAQYLRNTGKTQSEITLSFEKIEEIINDKLPKSARTYPAWWSNEVSQGKRVQSRAWMFTGWIVKHCDLEGELVTFMKVEL